MLMPKGPNFCHSCGGSLNNSPSFCPACGSTINYSSTTMATSNRKGIFTRFWKKSVKARIFYGAWVLLNVSNGLNLITSASAPVDRLRGVCNWEGVNCQPSSGEQALQSLFNLVLWNALFWAFRHFYRKRQSK